MQTVSFYLLPIKSYRDLRSQNICDLVAVIERIKSYSDKLIMPETFFGNDSDGNAYYSVGNSNMQLLTYLIGKFPTENYIKNLDGITTEDYHHRFISANDAVAEDEKSIIHNKQELLQNYQESAYCLPDFRELFEWKVRCFPDVLFTEDSFGQSHNIFHRETKDVYRRLLKQTIQCLTELNNQTEALHKTTVAEGISRLQAALTDISCSGKGSKEATDFNKNVSVNDAHYTIACAPHFKLIRGDSDYRIYFSWGKDEIRSNSFIVVKIGSHWNESADSQLARILLHNVEPS